MASTSTPSETRDPSSSSPSQTPSSKVSVPRAAKAALPSTKRLKGLTKQKAVAQSEKGTANDCTSPKSKQTCSGMPPPGGPAKGPKAPSVPSEFVGHTTPNGEPNEVESTSSSAVPKANPAVPNKRTAPRDVSPPGVAKRRKFNAMNEANYARPTHRMPNFQAGPSLDFTAFNSTIWEVTLGGTEFKYHAHEAILQTSPKFSQEIHRNKTAKGRSTVKQTLKIDGHDPGAFEQMLQFLYKGKFSLKKEGRPLPRLREYHELMALAKVFQLPSLQKQLVAVIAKSSLLKNITVWTFFDWAEDMFYEESDHKNGPFKRYFTTVAPHLLRLSAAGQQRQIGRNNQDEEDEDLFAKLLDQVKLGGEYSVELFRAMHTALSINEPIPAALRPDVGHTASASVAPSNDDDYIKEEDGEANGAD